MPRIGPTYGATLAEQQDNGGIGRRESGSTVKNLGSLSQAELVELAGLGAALLSRLCSPPPGPPALTLTETGAAKRLGVSAGFFKSYVLPDLRVIRRGARVLIPHSELERWIDRSAARTVSQ